jgi:DNA-binding NarL/FixJ family response regulator
VLKPEIHFPKRNVRSNVTANKYKKQVQWRQSKVRELLTRGYSQKEISSTLQISQPTVSRDISFIKNEFRAYPKIR